MLDLVTSLARQYRDELAALPARVSATTAADLNVDPHEMETALDRMIKTFLKSQSEPDVDRLSAMLAPRVQKATTQ